MYGLELSTPLPQHTYVLTKRKQHVLSTILHN